ncbi:MAG: S41 family peptidase [Myxococcota bacterium]
MKKYIDFSIYLALLSSTLILTPSSYAQSQNPTYDKLETFARVLSLVQNNYVEPVDEGELIYSSLKGMMNSLDPHSTFLTPNECKGLREDTTGEFGGVGVEVSMVGKKLTVMKVFERTPASRAGIKEGDVILTIDGEPAENIGLVEAVTRMRGRVGSSLVITVKRKGKTKPLSINLIRERIRIASVTGKLYDNKTGYIKISIFQEDTNNQLRRKINEMLKSAGGKLEGLVLDLRKNPGGLLKEAVRVADNFLSKGVIVITRGRGAPDAVEEAHSGKTFSDFPIVVLVDGQSASAAEIVAGSLQDHKRAIVVGAPTYGKGSVQTVIDMEDGSCAKLTIARYYTPSGRSIQELGIQPDVIVPSKLSPEDIVAAQPREVDLERHFKNLEKEGEEIKRETDLASEDPQLYTAIRLLSRISLFVPKEEKEKK